MKQHVRLFLAFLISLTVTACCDEKALSGALKDIYSDKASQRNKALQVISQCGKRGESAVPRIAQLMYDDNVGVASSAAYALRKIDSKAARAALKRAEDARNRNR